MYTPKKWVKKQRHKKEQEKKYYSSHKKYYSIKANEYQKRSRKLRDEYKQRIDDTIEYIKENQDMGEWIHIPGWELLNILEGKNE